MSDREGVSGRPLSEILKELKEKKPNIKDYRVFSLEYVPKEIFLRPQSEPIGRRILIHLEKGGGGSMMIIGDRGTGKTVTVRHLLKETEKIAINEEIPFQHFYIPAMVYRTTASILGFLASGGSPDYGRVEKLRSRGSILWAEAKNVIDSKRTVIVIDEADFLRDYTILYYLTRETQALIITISSSTKWVNNLGANILTSFQPEIVDFLPYSALELKEILLMRAKMGLETYDERGIELLSKIIADEYQGDARYGIVALRYLGEENSWDESSIREAVLTSIKNIEGFTMRRISREALELLRIVVARDKAMKQEEYSTTSLFPAWHEKTGRTKPTFHERLEELDKYGLITITERKRGIPLSISLRLRNTELIEEILKERGFPLY